MTAASSISFSMMEVPAMEDTMEMASPYPGTVDDFDIDLDVMEEHISNPDEDLMVADATPEPSHRTAYNNDETNDADMIDDVVERAMVDADDEQEMTGTTGAAQEYDERYEGEMLEDDYEEDIDAPVTDITEEVTQTLESTETLPRIEDASPAQHDTGSLEETEATIQQPGQQHKTVDSNNEDQEASIKIVETDTADCQSRLHSPGEDGIRSQHGIGHNETVGEEAIENVTQDTSVEAIPSAVKVDDQLAKDEGTNGVSQPPTTESSEGIAELAEVQHDQETKNQGNIARDGQLHPVKVLYQGNEISLFPPREDDSSETFFVENEGLAYDGFDKMFESFRQVLGDHVGEQEVLIVDVEPLNIQIREDSTHLPHVSLHQILDIYLQLCHNDDIHEPDAVYLTLSTAPNLSTELTELRAAAKEGKGLSRMQYWEDLEEISSGDRTGADERDARGPGADDPDDLNLQNSAHDEDRTRNTVEGRLDVEHRPSESEISVSGTHEEEGVLEHGGEGTTVQEDLDQPAQPVSAAEVEVGEPQESAGIVVVDEGSHDSEAGQTESTATLAPAAAAATEDGQSPGGVSDVNNGHEDTEAGDSSSYPVGHDDVGDPDSHQHDPAGEVDGPHDVNGESAEHYHGNIAAESGYQDDHAAADHEHDEYDVIERDGSSAADPTDRFDDAEYHAEESRDADSRDWPEDHELEGSGAAGDNLDDEEDLFEGTTEAAEEASSRQNDTGEQFAEPETSDAAEHVTGPGTLNDESENEVLDENDDLHDEGEYVDLEYDEDPEFGDEEANLGAELPSQPTASSKRSREENEEVDEVDAPTPDLKRTRSS